MPKKKAAKKRCRKAPPKLAKSIESDPRFKAFAEIFVRTGAAYPAAIEAGYAEDYARAHAYQLAARLRVKMSDVLRHRQLDEGKLADKLEQLLEAQRGICIDKSLEFLPDGMVQLRALEMLRELLGHESVTTIKGDTPDGSIPVRVIRHSIPRPKLGQKG